MPNCIYHIKKAIITFFTNERVILIFYSLN